MKKTYTGGCQCGKVRYEAQADIGEVITCNCSRCRKLGSLLAAVAMSDFKLLSGEDEMSEYQFNNRRIHHPFCKTCGIQSYAYGKGPGGRDIVMLNVRCLDGVDAEQSAVKKLMLPACSRPKKSDREQGPLKSHNGQTVVHPSQALGSIPGANRPKPAPQVPVTESQGRSSRATNTASSIHVPCPVRSWRPS